MDRKFGTFFCYALAKWREPLREKWKVETFWSLLTAILSYVIMSRSIGVSEMSTEIKITLSLIGGAFVTQIIRLVWLLLNAPFAILKEQREKLDAIAKNQLSDPLEFILKEPEYTNKNNERACVYIFVHNISKQEIEDCGLRVKTEKMNLLTQLAWSGNNRISDLEYQHITIAPDDLWRADIAVAWLRDSNAVFCIFPLEKDDRIILPGIYEIAISASGRILGDYIEHQEQFVLKYEGENKLHLKKKV